MKQIFLSGKGEIEVLDAPAPAKLRGSVLVKNAFSLISTGTEAAAVTAHQGWRGLYEKAVSSRDRLEQVWSMSQAMGMTKTLEMVRNKLDDLNAIGYSSAGTVVESDVPGLEAGHRVACMGVGFANHAEYVTVPSNLVAAVPGDVAMEDAAFGAVACIALQGVRRLEMNGGERVAVIGLGLIGQIAVRLLDALGCVAFALDVNAARVAMAGTDGAQIGVDDLTPHFDSFDGAIVCAGTKSDEPVNLAFDLCRTRGRVSVVGDVGLGLERAKMYRKELDLRMSRSYGPGRYDALYEIEGIDYPSGYVRWTEKRNLEYILHLLGARKLDFAPLRNEVFDVDRAADAYRAIKTGGMLGVLVRYPMQPAAPQKTIRRPAPAATRSGVVRLGLIGTGSFTKGVHLPNIKRLPALFSVDGVASRTGASAAVVGRSAGARIVTSDYRELLGDPSIDAVLVATRHASHARIVLDALDAGKHVFIEKPMATTVADALAIVERAATAQRIVRVGFNRRFAPMMRQMRDAVGSQSERVFTIRVNIGAIANDWSNTAEEGGRLMGEGVHFFDLANWCCGAEPESMTAAFAGALSVTNPNCMLTLRYPNGNVAQIVYTSLGDAKGGKERYELFGGQRTLQCDDFRTLDGAGVSWRRTTAGRGNKGHLDCLAEFAAAIRGDATAVAGADARAGLVATWVAETAMHSARSKQAVAFDL